MIEAKHYNGPPTCAEKGCSNPARWMPVLVMVAKGYEERADTRIPVGLLSLGVCDACKAVAGKDLAENVAPDLRDSIVNRGLLAAGLAEARFDRVEWVEIAGRA